MANKKISELTAKGSNLEDDDLFIVSDYNGSTYDTKSITGLQIKSSISAGGLTYFTEAQSTTTPNNVVNVDSLTAVASTTDADISIVPKGNGAFQLDIPDSSITGGNKRGTNSIDLQISRTASTQVASGNYSVVIGNSNTASNTSATAIGQLNIANAIGSTSLGYSNTSSGSYATSSGFTNIASGNSSVALGSGNTASSENAISLGISNTASGYRGAAVGTLNTSTGTYSYSIGFGNSSNRSNSVAIGSSCSASGDGAIAIGNSVNTFLAHGRMSFSSGAISTGGDIQKSFFILKGRTTDATLKTLTSDNSGLSVATLMILQNNNVFRFKGSIVGKQTGTTNVGVWDIDGVAVRGSSAGTTILVGTPTITAVTNLNSWGTPTITADTSLGGININVIGALATNIQWIANIETSEVIY